MNNVWELAVKYKIQQKQEEFMSLLKLAKLKNTNSVLEIGCYDGGTTAGFTSICKRVVTCDLNLRFNVQDFKNMCDYTFIEGNSQDVDIINKVKYTAGKVDLLFIDGDHTSEGSLADYNNYKSLVNPGGIIAFHDIVDSPEHRKLNCYVFDAWNKAKEMYDSTNVIEYISDPITWGGIGVILV